MVGLVASGAIHVLVGSSSALGWLFVGARSEFCNLGLAGTGEAYERPYRQLQSVSGNATNFATKKSMKLQNQSQNLGVAITGYRGREPFLQLW